MVKITSSNKVKIVKKSKIDFVRHQAHRFMRMQPVRPLSVLLPRLRCDR
jgi:hypothetical protein